MFVRPAAWLATSLALAASLVFGCRKADDTSVAFRGLYQATTTAGQVGSIAFLVDGTYVLRTQSCRTSGCLETGTATLDAKHEKLTLVAAYAAGQRTLLVDVLETALGTLETGEIGEAGATAREAGAGAVDGGTMLADGGQTSVAFLGTIRRAILDGAPVALLDDASGDAGTVAANGNQDDPPWPGKIPGVGKLSAPIFGDQTTTNQPSGNGVSVADRTSSTVGDAALAARYVGSANLYDSPGMPGMLIGGIPEERTRQLLRSPDPLIVASCFAGARMAGGSTIRRLVSTYADDQTAATAVASRVYGCTGFVSASADARLGCDGTWVNASGQAMPFLERQRLSLAQVTCATSSSVDGQRFVNDCPVRAE